MIDKRVIIFMGLPNCGKDTQADILDSKLPDYFRLRSSKLLEEKFRNADDSQSDYSKLLEEKNKWEAGLLNDPNWVTPIIVEKINEVADSGQGIILSGSPRTLPEAEAEIPALIRHYGKDSIVVFDIEISEEESFKRSQSRRICEANKHPIDRHLLAQGISECPIDGSKIISKSIDDPSKKETRFAEYHEKTQPVIQYLEDHDIEFQVIPGERSEEEIAADIDKYLEI